jgi:hypothetical protein
MEIGSMSNQEPANKPAPDAPTGASGAQPAAKPVAAAAPQQAGGAAPVVTGAPAPAVSGPTPAPTSGDEVGARVESGLGTATAAQAPAVLSTQSLPVVPASGEGAMGQGAGAASSSAPGAGLPLTAAHPTVTAGSTSVAAADAAVADRTRPLGPLPDAPAPDKTQRLPDLPDAAPTDAAQQAPADVGARAAAAIRDQMEPLAMRIQYDTQELLRVGAAAPDPVTIRLILDTWAHALERGDGQTFAYTFSRADGTLPEQINDQVLPYNLVIQIGGYFEAIVRDTLSEAFAGEPALAAASSRLLDELAAPAKRALLGEPRSLIQWQAPRV